MAVSVEQLRLVWQPPGGLAWFTAVNHRVIGLRFIVTAFIFFLIGGIEAALMRWQLAQPGSDVLSADAYNQMFTMHGSTMMFLFVVPILEGFAIYLLPLMLGAREMPFPRMNALGYWLFLFGGIFLYASFLFGTVPDGGWFAYVPLTGPEFSPGMNMDFWLLGISLVELSGIMAAVEIVVMVFRFRAPGMSINRMPIFAWNVLATAVAILFAFPVLVVGSTLLELDRAFGTAFFNVQEGGVPELWQHLFWVFGHPEVYIMLLPAVGFVSMIVPTFSARPIVGYSIVVLSAIATAFLSFGLWVHHMFTTGLPWLAFSFFAAASMTIAIPSGLQIFAWIATLWTGRPVFTTPLLFVLGFLVLFVAGGITGVMVAVVPFNWQVHDTYFIVAHFHYVLIGGVLFPLFGAIYYWWPKMTGRMLSERMGKLNFWLLFIGFNVTFFPMHITGLLGMPRRVYTYSDDRGWEALNLVSSLGVVLLALAVILFLTNVVRSLLAGEEAGDNPWRANTLEWATTSPPQSYNFERIPTIASRDPLWDGSDLYPVGEEPSAADAEAAREGRRETLTSSVFDAEQEGLTVLPIPSAWPLATALGAVLVMLGLLASQYWISWVGLAATVAAVGAWHWSPRPSRRDVSWIDDDDDPPAPAGDRASAAEESPTWRLIPASPSAPWWGAVCAMLALSSITGALLFSYFIIWANATEWPLADLDRPQLLVPGLATIALLLGGGTMLFAGRAAAAAQRRRLGLSLAISLALGLVFLALLAADYAQADFGPRTNAYGSLYFVLTGFVAANVIVALLATVWALGRASTGTLKPGYLQPMHILSAYAAFVAVAWVVVAAVVYLVPYLGASGEQIAI